jgi:hypothetical protein
MFGHVGFVAETEADIDRFVREYVLDAIDRVDKSGICDGISFDRDEVLPFEGATVALAVVSDFDSFVEHEREHWERYREQGVIEDWHTKQLSREQVKNRFGEQGFELARRLIPLGGRMAKLAYEEFDDEPFPPAEDAYPEEDGVPTGWWAVPHHVTAGNLGYSPREEIRMHRSTLDEDLRLIAERDGPEAVDEEVDDFIDALKEMREDVKKGREGP